MPSTVILYLLLFFTAVALPVAPWISSLSYVLNSLIQPQYIWHWIFSAIPIFKITAILSILGFLILLIQKKIEFKVYRERQNVALLSILVLMYLSHWLTEFQTNSVSVPPRLVLDTMGTVVLMYFILLPVLNGEKQVKYFSVAFLVAGFVYIVWANLAYFNGDWHLFKNNRLEGPFEGPYRDGNVLSTFVVMTMPYFILLGFVQKNILIRTMIVITVLLLWHALLLFSSRGAILACGVSLLLICFMIKSRKLNVFMAVAFVCFVFYQGAALLERTNEIIRDDVVVTDEPLNPRLVSWTVGLKLILTHPFLGVGVQKFEAASDAYYPGETAHVAHNTFLNFAANSGLITGLLFLYLVYGPVKRLLKFRESGCHLSDHTYISYALVASSISIIGFFVCSIFLDLIIFEPFYFSLIINLLSWRLVKEKLPSPEKKLNKRFNSVCP